MDAYRLLFVASIATVVPLLRAISMSMAVGLDGVSDSDSGSMRQTFGFLNLFMAILVWFRQVVSEGEVQVDITYSPLALPGME